MNISRNYCNLRNLIILGCMFFLQVGVVGCRKDDSGIIRNSEIIISAGPEEVIEGYNKDNEILVLRHSLIFETLRYSLEDIRVATYVGALGGVSKFIGTEFPPKENVQGHVISQSEFDLGECIVKTFDEVTEDWIKGKVEFFKSNDLMFCYSYDDSLQSDVIENRLKLSELKRLLSDSKYTVKVISERAILNGRFDVNKDNGIGDVSRFNAVKGGEIELVVTLAVGRIPLKCLK